MSRYGQITTPLRLESLLSMLSDYRNETKVKVKISRDSPMSLCYVERTKLPGRVVNLGKEW
jgi:hypothetical protein